MQVSTTPKAASPYHKPYNARTPTAFHHSSHQLMANVIAAETNRGDEEGVGEMSSRNYMNGVRHLCDSGITKVPAKYILPLPERPLIAPATSAPPLTASPKLLLPVVDVGRLQSADREQVIKTLDEACKEYGFFQVVNHGIDWQVIKGMMEVGKRFFELPFEERAKYMTTDVRTAVRCGTSFNQIKDRVFYWRDFLKLSCHPLHTVLPHWPNSPRDLREKAMAYSNSIKCLFLVIMRAVLESLGVESTGVEDFDGGGSQLLVINCYPECPEPDLTLGMPPHSDYGFLTLLLQDDTNGLQVQRGDQWITIHPLPNSFLVNVGDHLEIFSNGRYRSVLHRVLVNSRKTRVSVASLHSLSFDSVVRPSPELVSQENPRRYGDTDFAAFLQYMAAYELKHKNFLKSRKLTLP